MGNSEYIYDLFVSFSHADQVWVRKWLMPRLEKAGLRVCIGFRDFDIGVPTLVNIERAVERSRKTLLILTPDWVGSEWASFESLLAQTQDPSGLRQRTLPLMLEPCEPPKRVSMLTPADFTDTAQWESELKRIIDAVNDRVGLLPQEMLPSQVSTRRVRTPTNNLDIHLDIFIGREREVAELKQLLSSVRLLTLTGAPGTGKTRLALRTAGDLVDEYEDGVWQIRLGPLRDHGDRDIVAREVARTLGVQEEPGCSLIETLVAALQHKRLLILLDNCEHLIDGSAALANALLPRCPDLLVLATSREALKVSGEVAWVVPPMDLPDPRQQLPPVNQLMDYDAIHLFMEHAHKGNPHFALTNQNAGTIVQVCRRLGGLPMAIGLVAAWVSKLPVEQIASRLEERFWQLTGARRTALPHQQALHETIDWSYQLLTENEQVTFGRLSAFAGGFTLEAAEVIAAGGIVKAYEILDHLAGLVDKSLVIVEERDGGAMRYGMLEPLRHFGAERLDISGETAGIHVAYAKYYLALAEETEPKLVGSGQAAAQDRLEEEYDNLRAVLRWAQKAEEQSILQRLSAALARFWWVRGYLSEGQSWLEKALAQDGVAAPALQAKLLHGAGRIADHQGDFARAQVLLQQSLALYRELGDKPAIANTLSSLGIVCFVQGDFPNARDLLDKSQAIHRQVGDRKGLADSLQHLGGLALLQRDFGAARAFLRESLPLYEDLGHSLGTANSQHDLGVVARYQGDLAEARELLEKSLTQYRELGHRPGIARALKSLGDIALERCDFTTTRALYAESLAIVQELEIKEGLAYLLEGFAGLSCAQNQPARATRLFGAADALRRQIGAPLPPDSQEDYRPYLTTIESELDEEDFATAWSEGQKMSMEQAIKYALREEPPVRGTSSPSIG